MAMTLYATNFNSNDGSKLLWQGCLERSLTITVTATGATINGGDNFTGVWAYGGIGTFLGLATSRGASSATYPVGTTFTTAQSTLNLYVVTEGGGDITVEPLSVTANGTYTAPTGKAYSPVTVNVGGSAPTVSVYYDDQEIISFASGNKTLQCAGKVMAGNVVVSVE